MEQIATADDLQRLWAEYFAYYLDPLSRSEAEALAHRWSECPLRLVTVAFRIADERMDDFNPTLNPKKAKRKPEDVTVLYMTGILRNSVIGEARKADLTAGLPPKAKWIEGLDRGWESPNDYEAAYPLLFSEDRARAKEAEAAA
jgi:hypothetical protein